MIDSTVYESFTLPSKGLVYDKPINSTVTLRSMTTMEEMKRLAPSDTPYKVLADIIEDCMKEKPEIHVYNMCLGDYLFLMNKVRVVTYGAEYKIRTTCPECGEVIDAIGDLDSLEVHEYDNSIDEMKMITLPITNKAIELKMQTPKDLDMIAYRNKEMKKKMKTSVDFTFMYTVASMIKKVDGQVRNILEMEEFVKQLPMRDAKYIVDKANELNGKVGLDNTMMVTCNQCGAEFPVTFRYTREFFGPTEG